MSKNIYYYETLKNSLKNFLRQKNIKMPDMVKSLAEEPEKYFVKSYKPKIENLNKTTISLTGDRKYFKILENDCNEKRMMFGPYLGKLVYNYMYIHKDDEPIKSEKLRRVTIYFKTEEWENLSKKIGSKSINEYIRGVILNAE